VSSATAARHQEPRGIAGKQSPARTLPLHSGYDGLAAAIIICL